MVNSPMIIRAIDILYLCWFYLLFLSCLWMAWTPRRHLRLCYLVSTLLVWVIIGSVFGHHFVECGSLFLFAGRLVEHNPYAPLMRRLSEISELGTQGNGMHLHATFNQAGLWGREDSRRMGAVWTVYRLCRAFIWPWQHSMPGLPLRCANGLAGDLLAYVVLILIGSIILGWHYAVDGYAGIILASLIWLGIKRLVYRTAPQPA